MIEPYYQDEWATLYCGDCADIAPQLGVFDLLLTDPPYGIDVTRINGTGRNGLANATRWKDSKWDKAPPPPHLMTALMKQAKHHIIWGGNYFNVPPSKCWLVWDKVNGTNDFADCELAYTNLDMAVRMKTWRWNGMLQQNMKNKETRMHPTQKPVPVLEWCLSFVPQARTVFDPFAGSGTTGVACKRNRRRCVMIERDPDYCAIAAKRLAETQPMMEWVVQPVPHTEAML